MNTANETINLNDNTGLEIDFSRIAYAKPDSKGPTWFTSHLEPATVRRLCGKAGTGFYSVTEDELEVALIDYLAEVLKCPVASFSWQWDTYHVTKVA